MFLYCSIPIRAGKVYKTEISYSNWTIKKWQTFALKSATYSFFLNKISSYLYFKEARFKRIHTLTKKKKKNGTSWYYFHIQVSILHLCTKIPFNLKRLESKNLSAQKVEPTASVSIRKQIDRSDIILILHYPSQAWISVTLIFQVRSMEQIITRRYFHKLRKKFRFAQSFWIQLSSFLSFKLSVLHLFFFRIYLVAILFAFI